MRHLMLLGPTFRGRHAPGSSRRAFEHKARSRAGLAEGVIEITDRLRPVGILVAILRIAARLLDSDLLPVGVQFVGHHHEERGAYARTHLLAWRNDGYRDART